MAPHVEVLLEGFGINTSAGRIAMCQVTLIEGQSLNGEPVRLLVDPAHVGRRTFLLEALAFWQKQPVHAVFAVDGGAAPSASRFLRNLDETHARTPRYTLDVVEARRRRRRASERLDGLGDFRDLRQLMLANVAR